MIQIYKPTARNTGAAISFQASDRDRHLYVNMIRQFSWDASRKTGSFIENRGKPGMSTALKFNQLEAAGIIDAIETSSKFTAFHDSGKRSTTISFEISEQRMNAEGQPIPQVFIFKVSQTDTEDTTQKANFFIPISFAEARLIKEYLIHYLHKSFKTPPQPRKNAPVAQESTGDGVADAPTTEQTGGETAPDDNPGQGQESADW